jgi:hypothetical protein
MDSLGSEVVTIWENDNWKYQGDLLFPRVYNNYGNHT